MHLFTTYFSDTQILLLVVSLLALLSSFFFHIKGKNNLALMLMLFSAFSIFCFGALLDPFLNLWDERFHALVGKNLMHHPLMPTLYDDPVVKMPYDRWDRDHIWLHKEPLFLWQIALSFKLFGISEFTLRLPSVLLGVVFVFISYRSGMLLINKRVGYLTGLLIISSLYILELIGGSRGLDLNDVSFMVYVSLSIWSFIEYYFSGNKRWIYLIGLFSGMAILCKWMVGLLVYFGWFVLKLQQKKYKISHNKDLFASIIITLLVVLPWHILTYIWYPSEATSAYKYNNEHFFTPIEGFRGSFWYHFEMINIIYGAIALFLIVPAFYFLFKKGKEKPLFYSLLGMVLMVYLFFTLAATKMPSFTIVVSMIIFISFASLWDKMLDFVEYLKIKKRVFNCIFFLSIFAVILFRFDIELLQEKHTTWKKDNVWTAMLKHNKEVFKSLNLPKKSVIFNVLGRHYIEAMFYTGLPAYNFIPTKEQYDDLKSKGRTIALFKLKKADELPDYLKNDSSIIIINEEIQGDD